MALWFMDSEKKFQQEYWSNRYVIEAASLATAVAFADAIRSIEHACTHTFVTLTKYRVSSDNVGDDVYQITNDNVAGALTYSGSVLPLFNRVRCDFNTVGGGRPSRKYWCPALTENDVNGMVLEASFIEFMEDNYVAPLLSITGYVDVDGQAFSSGSVFPDVAMRQLRRGSKRKLLPIIP